MRPSTTSLFNAFGIALLVLAFGCDGGDKGGGAATEGGPKRVVATTTMIADLAQEIGGADVEVVGIMKPGGDPHLYKPTPADAKRIAQSHLVLTNGMKLEGWIDDLVRNAGGDARVAVVTRGLSALKDPAKTNYPDPHIWHDVSMWVIAAQNVRDDLVTLSPKHAEAFKKRAADLETRLLALDAEVKKNIHSIPADRRVLITSHDAFQYYGKAYGLEVVAVQGLSTESEAGARDVARVVDIIKAKKIPAIFVETSVNPKLIEQISRETGARIGGTLFSDSLGDDKGAGATYIGMIQENTRLIVSALGAPAPKD